MYFDEILASDHYADAIGPAILLDAQVFLMRQREDVFCSSFRLPRDELILPPLPYDPMFVAFPGRFGILVHREIINGAPCWLVMGYENGHTLNCKEQGRRVLPVVTAHGGIPYCTAVDETTGEALPEHALCSEASCFEATVINQARAVETLCGLLNSKAAKVETVSPPRDLQKAREKKGKNPLVEYRVLTLELPPPPKTEQGFGAHASPRLHTCRGHFMTFTEDRPAFGKLSGRFWCPPHWKGQKSSGAILKRYEV
jgi:hypothetical protein